MTEQWIGDILDGVSVLVVLLLILTSVAWYYGSKILKELKRINPPQDGKQDDDR